MNEYLTNLFSPTLRERKWVSLSLIAVLLLWTTLTHDFVIKCRDRLASAAAISPPGLKLSCCCCCKVPNWASWVRTTSPNLTTLNFTLTCHSVKQYSNSYYHPLRKSAYVQGKTSKFTSTVVSNWKLRIQYCFCWNSWKMLHTQSEAV